MAAARRAGDIIAAMGIMVLVALLISAVGLRNDQPLSMPEAGAQAISIKSISSPAVEASRLACTASCNVYSVYVTTGATAGFFMTFPGTTNPPASPGGAVVPTDCVAVPAGATAALDYSGTNEPFSGGLVVAFSTTGCFVYNGSNTAFFKVRKSP
jgi:hypothetical protein